MDWQIEARYALGTEPPTRSFTTAPLAARRCMSTTTRPELPTSAQMPVLGSKSTTCALLPHEVWQRPPVYGAIA
jgi:hypothetical protein